MSAKHTPGPWVVNKDQSRCELGVDTAGGEWGICLVADAAGETLDHSSENASEANARLIAAAPDLLEALRAFMALDRDFSTASDRHLREIIAEQRASAPLVKAVIAARAAIAKATGAA
jgi:hypothetical protein